MSLNIFFRIVPTVLRHNGTKTFGKPQILCNQRKIVITHNLTNNEQVRYFIKDASRYEVEDGRKRIYYGILTPQIRAVKWFSLSTSIMGLISQPFLIKELSTVSSIPTIVAAYSIISFFTFGTPLLLHYITKKYVSYLDYNSEKGTYIASTINFFCVLRETEFTPEDVKVPDIPGMFTTFKAKGKAMFLDAKLFADPSHYSKIMGYDKPIDFKMFENPPEEEQRK